MQILTKLLFTTLIILSPLMAIAEPCGANAVFCTNFNGTDGATSATDIASGGNAPHTITFVGTAQLDTAQKKFGTSSLLLDGNSDYVQLADSADWTFGSGDFTVDYWVRYTTVDTGGHWAQRQTAAVRQGMYRSGSGLRYLCDGAVDVQKAWTPSTNTWYHIALTREGNNWKLYVDGTQLSTTVVDSSSIPDLSAVLNIGYWADVGYLTGWIDEFRISKGVALWTENFTPPSTSFVESSGGSQIISSNLF